jgi:hypothetical protein
LFIWCVASFGLTAAATRLVNSSHCCPDQPAWPARSTMIAPPTTCSRCSSVNSACFAGAAGRGVIFCSGWLWLFLFLFALACPLSGLLTLWLSSCPHFRPSRERLSRSV